VMRPAGGRWPPGRGRLPPPGRSVARTPPAAASPRRRRPGRHAGTTPSPGARVHCWRAAVCCLRHQQHAHRNVDYPQPPVTLPVSGVPATAGLLLTAIAPRPACLHCQAIPAARGSVSRGCLVC
jgi:hypothetical protein